MAKTKIIEFAWTSDGLGDATKTLKSYYGAKILSVETKPSATAAPTAYSVTLIETGSDFDLFVGELASCSATADNIIWSNPPVPMPESLSTITIAGAGATKEGILKLYIEYVV